MHSTNTPETRPCLLRYSPAFKLSRSCTLVCVCVCVHVGRGRPVLPAAQRGALCPVDHPCRGPLLFSSLFMAAAEARRRAAHDPTTQQLLGSLTWADNGQTAEGSAAEDEADEAEGEAEQSLSSESKEDAAEDEV
eukprot:2407295-Pyramimonas_sp.AAC.1